METHSGKRKAPRPLCLRVRHTPCWTAACWQSPVDLCTERKRLQRNALAFKSSSNRQMTWVPRAGWGEMPREEPQIEQLLGGGTRCSRTSKRKVLRRHTVPLCSLMARCAPVAGSEEQVPARPAESSKRGWVPLAQTQPSSNLDHQPSVAGKQKIKNNN